MVEDDLPLLYERSLSLIADFQVETAITATEAVMKARSHKPDLAILDIRLPGTITGLQLIPVLREIDEDLPIIVITAWPLHLQEAKDIGANEALLKPVSLPVLLSLVRQYLGLEDGPTSPASGRELGL